MASDLLLDNRKLRVRRWRSRGSTGLVGRKRIQWVVYAKPPFAGPAAVLAYLSRYTHRVAIANSRLIAHDERGVTFKWKDYRAPARERYKTMTLTTDEFIRRFLLHVHPRSFHRIRHYGLLANHQRVNAWLKARELLGAEGPPAATKDAHTPTFVCPACGAAMIVIEQFERGHAPRVPPVVQVHHALAEDDSALVRPVGCETDGRGQLCAQ